MKKVIINRMELRTLHWWAYTGVICMRGGSHGDKIIPLLKKLKKEYNIREPKYSNIKFKEV